MTGRNVEEAVALACEELGVSRDSVEVEVIELQKKSFFGLKVTPAKVKVTFEQTKGDLAAEYVGEILEAMGVKAEITVENTDDGALIKLEGGGSRRYNRTPRRNSGRFAVSCKPCCKPQRGGLFPHYDRQRQLPREERGYSQEFGFQDSFSGNKNGQKRYFGADEPL